jgi:CBS domain-containing protein
MTSPAKPASELTASDVMTASPRTCSPFSTVLEAVLIFRDANCGVVPVVDAGEPVGVLTDRDVALALADYPDLVGRPVSDIMTKGVLTIAPEASLVEVIQRFGAECVRRLIVTRSDGQLLGIVTWADVAPYLGDLQLRDAAVTEVVQHS